MGAGTIAAENDNGVFYFMALRGSRCPGYRAITTVTYVRFAAFITSRMDGLLATRQRAWPLRFSGAGSVWRGDSVPLRRLSGNFFLLMVWFALSSRRCFFQRFVQDACAERTTHQNLGGDERGKDMNTGWRVATYV